MLHQHHQIQHQQQHCINQSNQFLAHQQQQQKAFVCEICGKAFRFRSNLAEHRSVHTAVKPFVCKFCGKSSRLKGNLTKHILKHHKTEQRDYIGTDDYIIKKGKKSVKDPAAIEFLERSMIVLNNSSNSSAAPHSNDGEDEEEERNGSEASEPAEDCQQGILLSLGLDGGSLDLKTESISDGGDEPMATDYNERLLVNCESAIGGGSGAVQEGLQCCRQSPRDKQPVFSGHSQTNNALTPTAACKALFSQMDGRALAKAFFGASSTPAGNEQQEPLLEGVNDELLRLVANFGEQDNQQHQHQTEQNASSQQQIGGGGGCGGGSRMATQCQQCGKHFRKPRDLIAHLGSAHKSLPSQHQEVSPSSSAHSSDELGDHQTSSSAAAGGGRMLLHSDGSGKNTEQLAQEVRQLRDAIADMKTGLGIGRLEQMLGQLDSRVARLEKQLEMALNSIYTLVQLQTGINNSVGKLSRSLLNGQ